MYTHVYRYRCICLGIYVLGRNEKTPEEIAIRKETVVSHMFSFGIKEMRLVDCCAFNL